MKGSPCMNNGLCKPPRVSQEFSKTFQTWRNFHKLLKWPKAQTFTNGTRRRLLPACFSIESNRTTNSLIIEFICDCAKEQKSRLKSITKIHNLYGVHESTPTWSMLLITKRQESSHLKKIRLLLDGVCTY